MFDCFAEWLAGSEDVLLADELRRIHAAIIPGFNCRQLEQLHEFTGTYRRQLFCDEFHLSRLKILLSKEMMAA